MGRSSSHRKAMLRNLASGLILTERDAEFDENPPETKGRVVTTLHKAKEVRPLVEKCVTIARRSLEHTKAARQYSTDAERNSDEWKEWRNSDQWQQWNRAIAPAVSARRRVLQLLGDKEAVSVLFEDIAPRFEERDGGYTRILRLARPRLGDGGTRAILEFVGVHDRETIEAEQPSFTDEEPEESQPTSEPEASAGDTTGEPTEDLEASTEEPTEAATEEGEQAGQEEEKVE